MKRKIFMCMACCFVLLSTACNTEDASLLVGDVDADGIVTVRDVQMILEHSASTGLGGTVETAINKKTADIDANGAVNAIDAAKLCRIICSSRL